MFKIDTLLIMIPLLPLLATVVTAVLGKWVLRDRSHWPAVTAIAGSCALSCLLVFEVQKGARSVEEQGGPESPKGYEFVMRPALWTWGCVEDAYTLTPPGSAPAADPADGPQPGQPTGRGPGRAVARDFRVDIALRADPLTAIMLATVTFVSMVVAIYSIGYMHADPGYWRFFTYISLFVFSMTMLVSASNFVVLYVFWEGVGFCSYILIGFWYQKPAAAAAGKKAFLVNRVGDFGFALGVFLLWTTYGTLNFHDTGVDGILGQRRLEAQQAWLQQQEQALGDQEAAATGGPYYQGTAVATAICLLLMLGACGKSAQFPLHVWLPDAMEGPTPVSALIHAATMVTAGVYMVARCMPLFLASKYALPVVAVIGGFTALLAALIALTQTDLKRILAYSTISQLGYMFLGLGTATLAAPGKVALAVAAGMFHLFTHAFFKGLLFLGAGSVMHAMGGVIDIGQFGGLRRRLPVTHWTFLFGCLALAGLIPFAGFWSKDLILAAVDGRGGALFQALYWAAVFTALLTAFYSFRAFFVTFYGQERIPPQAGDHAHESPATMTVPLVILAVCSLAVGAYFEWTGGFVKFLEQTPSLAYLGAAHHEFPLGVAVTGTVIVLVGIGAAAFLYLGRKALVERLTQAFDSLRLYRLSHGKFFFDEIYDFLVVRPLRGIAWLSYAFDRYFIDGLVDVVGVLPKLVGAALRPLQNGLVQFYALAMVLGLLVLLGALLSKI